MEQKWMKVSEKDCSTVWGFLRFHISWSIRVKSCVVNFQLQSSSLNIFTVFHTKPDLKVFPGLMHLFKALARLPFILTAVIAARHRPLFFCLCCNCLSTALFHSHISLWSAISHEKGPEKLSDRGLPLQLHRLLRRCESGIQVSSGDMWGLGAHRQMFGKWDKVLQKICAECVTERGGEKLSPPDQMRAHIRSNPPVYQCCLTPRR